MTEVKAHVVADVSDETIKELQELGYVITQGLGYD